MKTTNQDHHAEQMEAMRAEFAKLWTERLVPWLRDMRIEPRAASLFEDLAWKAFKAGKESSK
jgi:hypothetical protein